MDSAATPGTQAEALSDGPDAAAADTTEAWRARLEAIGEELGHFQPLGPRHAALFVDDAPTLLVTFEAGEEIRRTRPGRMPLGYAVARAEGWSHLCLIAEGETWYRDAAVWGYFDRLVDDAFFEDFDRVVFYGAGAGGYAAAAFSVAAPGATVVLLRPQATLAARQAGWDGRFRAHRRLDFASRYGYAPDMIEGAGAVFLIHDPSVTPDAMHAALFARPFVTRLDCRHLGPRPEAELDRMEILPELLRRAARGSLDAAGFFRLYRARRDHAPYVLRLLARLESEGREGLARRLERWVIDRPADPADTA